MIRPTGRWNSVLIGNFELTGNPLLKCPPQKYRKSQNPLLLTQVTVHVFVKRSEHWNFSFLLNRTSFYSTSFLKVQYYWHDNTDKDLQFILSEPRSIRISSVISKVLWRTSLNLFLSSLVPPAVMRLHMSSNLSTSSLLTEEKEIKEICYHSGRGDLAHALCVSRKTFRVAMVWLCLLFMLDYFHVYNLTARCFSKSKAFHNMM